MKLCSYSFSTSYCNPIIGGGNTQQRLTWAITAAINEARRHRLSIRFEQNPGTMLGSRWLRTMQASNFSLHKLSRVTLSWGNQSFNIAIVTMFIKDCSSKDLSIGLLFLAVSQYREKSSQVFSCGKYQNNSHILKQLYRSIFSQYTCRI